MNDMVSCGVGGKVRPDLAQEGGGGDGDGEGNGDGDGDGDGNGGGFSVGMAYWSCVSFASVAGYYVLTSAYLDRGVKCFKDHKNRGSPAHRIDEIMPHRLVHDRLGECAGQASYAVRDQRLRLRLSRRSWYRRQWGAGFYCLSSAAVAHLAVPAIVLVVASADPDVFKKSGRGGRVAVGLATAVGRQRVGRHGLASRPVEGRAWIGAAVDGELKHQEEAKVASKRKRWRKVVAR